MILSTLFSLALGATVPQETDVDPLYLVNVELGAQRQGLDDLAAQGIDVSHMYLGAPGDAGPGIRTAELVIGQDHLEALRRAGWKIDVVIDDLANHYAQRLQEGFSTSFAGTTHGSWLTPPYASGAMSGFYSFAEVSSVLDQIQGAYPSIVSTKTSIGQSLQGRDLWMVKVSDNPNVDENEPEVRFDALHHAREPQSMQTTLWFLLWLVESYGVDPLATYLVDEREIYIIPCVNPDGYVYNQQSFPSGGGLWRKNRRNNGGGEIGVDLNRNYPYQWGIDDEGSSSSPSSEVFRGSGPASEPEVQAMVSFISSRDFRTALSVHSFSDVWLSPLGYVEAAPTNAADYEEVGALATEFNGYPYGPASIILYLANGTTLDYDHGVHDSMAWTPEIGSSDDGFWPVQSRIVPLAEQNRLALARTALAAGSYLRVEAIQPVENAGDGDGDLEGGELVRVEVDVRNSGMQDSAATTVQLINVEPPLQVINGSETLGVINSFSTASTSAHPILRIPPGTPVGTYSFDVQVSSAGWQENYPGSLTIGSTETLISYDFEAGGAQGWAVGAPDNASTGNWTRVNPRGTDAQPEDDHTPGGGNTICWVTGQGSVGGSIGENDVDGGTTSLISPLFDLSGSLEPKISYFRWYSNSEGGSPNADVFEVDISNDGGASWTNAETVGPAGPGTSGGWVEALINVEDLLLPTDQMRLRFRASDLGDGSIIEAAIDDLTIFSNASGDCPAPVVYCTGEPNSVGPGAQIYSTGSTGVSDADFRLNASGVPPTTFGLFFYGSGVNDVPLGEGRLCVSSPFTRLTVQQTDSAGEVSQLLDLAGPIVAGSSWNFQFWYRDVAGGPLGYNLSNALEVIFCN